MTDATPPPAHPEAPLGAPLEPGPARPTRRRPLLLGLVLLVGIAVLVAIGLGTAALLGGDDGPEYPKTWNAQVAPFVRVVEKQRGLEFKHPVAVRFLEPKAFEKTVRSDDGDLDAEDKKEIAETTALFRAFGLIDGDVDLFDAFNDASGSGTLAYYSFDTRSITVRGTKLSLATHATLVHELTHALQDQWFDIGDRLQKLEKKQHDGAPSTAYDVLDAIVEGDAERVADKYRETLTADERADLVEAEAADTSDATSDLDKLPKVVVTLLGAPYVLGEALTQAVAGDDDAKVDDLLRDPPSDDSALLDPLAVIGDLDGSVRVDVPEPADGQEKFDSGQVGALVTYLMLAQRIPLKQALDAADAWDGDAYLGYTSDEGSCAAVEFAADGDAGARRLTTALKDWIAAIPGTPATVTADGDHVRFASCDPGEASRLRQDSADKALELVATRGYLGVALVNAGAPATTARCLAAKLVDEYTIAQLNNPRFGNGDPSVKQRVATLAKSCA